jgi:glutamyl-tRNA synthetase
MKKIRTRFAPSPTGYVHIGSLRTVLFTYLIAKSEGGDIILRIEDTDSKREVAGAADALYATLNKMGLKFDEGPQEGGAYGPYIQSQRKDIYKKYAEELLAKGEAYHCFCTSERLEEMRAQQQAQKLPPRYDRCCRNLGKNEVEERLARGEKSVIRQAMPLGGEVVVNDFLRGEINFRCAELDDQVLIKSDGMPTYQFAVVVDDHLMDITYVVRGEEWIPSFPKNILLYKAFGWEAPIFIHLTLSLNKGGGKLSKRQGDVAVEDFLKKGYLPEALINFCALQGWHPKDEVEVMDLDTIISKFRKEDLGKSASVFDTDKLDYLNGVYIRQKGLEELAELCRPYMQTNLELTENVYKKSEQYLRAVIGLEQERLKTLSEITELTSFFFEDNLEYDKELLAWKGIELPLIRENLLSVLAVLETINDDAWNSETMNEQLMNYIKSREAKVGDYLWPFRVSLTGRKASPSPFDVAAVLGKAESLKRVKQAIERLTH